MRQKWNVIKNILVWLVAAVAICMMIFTIISVTTFDRTDRSLFGFKAFIVLSDSMSATDFSAGDLVLTRSTNPESLQIGDIIAYSSRNSSNYGETVTHKIRKMTTNEKGEAGFITYGTTTGTDDETMVTYPCIIGKYVGKLAGVGAFFQFLKTTPGYICCILLPFFILMIIQGIHCVRLFRQYKAEQNAELQAEREAIAAERAETQKMMQELYELKAKLNQSNELDKENGILMP